jgi:hypothetical protein
MDNRDLEAQLEAYARQLDEAAPGVDDLVPSQGAPGTASDEKTVVQLERRRRVPDWAFAGAAAAAVVVLIGSVAVFSSLRSASDEPVATAPPSTTSTIGNENLPSVESPAVLVSTEPVIGSETAEDGDLLVFFTLGDVVMSDGSFHALLGIESEEPRIVHATSVDGSTWVVDKTPVEMDGLDDMKLVRATTLLQLDDGSWVGYFDAMRDLGGFGDHQYRYWIHRGTAPDIGGPWTVDPNPVLDAGPDGSWDGGWVRNASVFPSDTGWTMYYLGAAHVTDGAGYGNVGIATSDDGVVWSKVDEPVLVADPESRFEDGGFNRIQVKFIDDQYLLTFAGKTGGNRGLATSPDGVVWTRDERNPILTNLEVPRSSIYDTAMVDDEGTIRWYVGAGGFSSMAVYELVLDL